MSTKIENINQLKVSIFYNKNSWRRLLSDCLNPFLFEQINLGNIGKFFIAFNIEEGDNIRLSFECLSPDKEGVAKAIHFKLSSFLIDNPSNEYPANYHGYRIFMNFPNNSLQYNLFNIDFASQIGLLQGLISSKIILTFSKEEFDDSTLLTFALSLIMNICKIWGDFNKKNVNQEIIKRLNLNNMKDVGSASENSILLEEDKQSINSLFKKNKKMIMNMYHEIFNNQSIIDDRAWVNELNECYSAFLIDANLSSQKKMILPLDMMIMNQINFRLDLLPLIYYLVHLCLKNESSRYSV